MGTTSQITPGILHLLTEAAGPGGATTDQAEIAAHVIEPRDRFHGASPILLRPATTQAVADIVGVCARFHVQIAPQGGNTSLVGGSVPNNKGNQVILNLSRMNRVREVDGVNDTMTVEAGCLLAQVQAVAEAAGRLFPLRIASEGSCQIGGNIASNAGGVNVLRYGNMRDLVLGLEAVLPNGKIWHGLRGLRKDNTGYDLKQLFIGSEGTLGIVTAATLKLFPRPALVEVALASVPSVGVAMELLARAKRKCGSIINAFELLPRMGIDFVLRHVPGTREPFAERHDWQVLIELAGGQTATNVRADLEALLGDAMEDGLVTDAVLATSQTQANALWHLREAMSDAQRPEGGSIKCDIAVPLSRVAAFVGDATGMVEASCPGARVVAFGHLGDGNIHFNISQPAGMPKQLFLDRWDELSGLVHDIAHQAGGTISAEHGLGRLKSAEIRKFKSGIELELMQRVKSAFDPDNLMNPGIIAFPELLDS